MLMLALWTMCVVKRVSGLLLSRLAEARLSLEVRQVAIQELAPLFSKPPKQPFCVSVARIEAGDGAEAAAGGKKRKGTRGSKAQQGLAHDGEQGKSLRVALEHVLVTSSLAGWLCLMSCQLLQHTNLVYKPVSSES